MEVFKVEMIDLGPLSFYLGIDVHQDSSDNSLHPTAYTKCIVELGGLIDFNPTYTPMEERLKLSRDSTTEVGAMQWQHIVASLRYLIHMRPDLAFAIVYGSQFM